MNNYRMYRQAFDTIKGKEIEEPKRTLGGCVDCDECPHRSETCLCDISDNDEECPLL